MKRYICAATVDCKKLGEKIWDVLHRFMTDPDRGFPEDEWQEYCFVDIKPWAEDPSYTRVEVRAEIGYDSMVELSVRLDPIVEKIDKDAYFDADMPGIISAIVRGECI